MNPKKAIISLLQDVEDGKYSNLALNKLFSETPFEETARSFIAEVFYGVIRNKLYLEYMIQKKVKSLKKAWIKHLLMLSIYQIDFMESDNAGVIWEAVELTKSKYGDVMGRFVNGTLRSYSRDRDSLINELKSSNEATYYSLPQWFYDYIRKNYGKDYTEAIKYFKRTPAISFRVNTVKYSATEFEALLAKMNVSILKKIDTVYYVSSGKLLYTPEFASGKFVVQDGSSYLAAALLEATPADSVLDTCAAPGGKSAIIADFMQNQGNILALDVYPHKIKLISGLCRKLGITNVSTINLDARKIANQGKKFDKILVDAPCSGLGVMAKKPESIYTKKEKNIKELADLQYDILEAASKVLKDGGTLVYSTCTITSEENTENIKKFLENNKNFTTIPIQTFEGISYTDDELGGRYINYREPFLDGFYMIRLHKTC